jgi:hypothetical protein
MNGLAFYLINQTITPRKKDGQGDKDSKIQGFKDSKASGGDNGWGYTARGVVLCIPGRRRMASNMVKPVQAAGAARGRDRAPAA